MKAIKYKKGAQLPDLPLTWRDRNGAVLPLSSATLSCKIGVAGQVALKNVTTVVGNDTAPNVVVQFGVGDLDLPPGNYQLLVRGLVAGRPRMEFWPLIIEAVVN